MAHESGDTLKVQQDFMRSVYKNELETAQNLLKSKLADVNKLNLSHKSALFLAVENENIPMVKMLLENGADINVVSYCNLYCSYETPLVTSARLRNRELVKLFLERGCKLGSSHSPINTVGKTAFHWACDFGDFEMAELLLRNGADINAKGPHMNTGLHFATISDQNAMVQWLLNRNAEITPNGDGRTILHIASVRGNFEIVKLVADHTRTNVKDNFGFCAFSLACLRGHFEIVSYLYDNCINKPDLDLEDSLQRSAESGYTQIMQFLLQKGASVNATNENGETPLSIACHGRHSQHDQYEAVKLLLEHDAQMTIVDSRGYTPLSMALLREQNDIAALLIQHGAPVDAIKPSYDSPLQIAFSTSNPLLVKYLIQAGCHLCREKWFSDKSASEKIAEFDFHIPGPLRFRQECQYQKEAWEWIKHKACQPRTLAQFARRCIRQHLLNVRNGKSILSSVKRLPLPFTLVKYVSLEDVLQE